MNQQPTAFDLLAEHYDYWKRTVNLGDEYRKIVGFLPAHTESILDVGCGTGRLTLYLADYAKHITGIDSSAEMIRQATKNQREQSRTNVEFVHASVETWECQAHQFDFIVGDKVLHHTDLDRVLPRLRDLLRPGGRIWVRDWVTEDIARRRSPIWQYWLALREMSELRGHGLKVMWRLARFRLSPTWIHHVCDDDILSPQQTMEIYQRHFPGCLLINVGQQVMMLWEFPDPAKGTRRAL
ncbi:MAG: class I SAM-dependent methyltransferase [Chloroflexi bacterium]|nr:class I SAM-dependent methyltransferase [Chloroflexota bacterium]